MCTTSLHLRRFRDRIFGGSVYMTVSQLRRLEWQDRLGRRREMNRRAVEANDERRRKLVDLSDF